MKHQQLLNSNHKYAILHVVFIFSFSFFNNLEAQVLKSGGTGYFAASILNANHGDLTNTLIAEGVAPAGMGTHTNGLTLGGGGSFMFSQRWILSGEGYHVFYPKYEDSESTIAMEGGGAAISAGYAILNKRKWLLYPSVGIGFSGYRINLTNRGEEPLQFGNTLIPANGSEQFISTMPVLDFRFSFSRLLSKKSKGLLLGLDLGYTLSFAGGTWKNTESGERLTELDPASFRGLYAKLVIGFGRFSFVD